MGSSVPLKSFFNNDKNKNVCTYRKKIKGVRYVGR